MNIVCNNIEKEYVIYHKFYYRYANNVPLIPALNKLCDELSHEKYICDMGIKDEEVLIEMLRVYFQYSMNDFKLRLLLTDFLFDFFFEKHMKKDGMDNWEFYEDTILKHRNWLADNNSEAIKENPFEEDLLLESLNYLRIKMNLAYLYIHSNQN